MRYTKFTLFLFPVFLFQNCGNKGDEDTLASTKTIEIQKDFLFGDSPEWGRGKKSNDPVLPDTIP